MDDIIASYLDSAEEASEIFLDIATDVADGEPLDGFIDEVFRNVHSLKGTAGFLKEDDGRLAGFEQLCHRYEHFLDGVRKKRITATPVTRELFESGLRLMADNIRRLTRGEELCDCGEFMEACRYASETGGMPGSTHPEDQGFMRISTRAGVVEVEVLADIKTTTDSLEFTRLLHLACEKVGSSARLVVDLNGHRLASIGVGAILSAKVKVAEVDLLNVPRIMEVYFKHFGFLEAGIKVVPDQAAIRSPRA